MEPRAKAFCHEASETSVNAIFAVTGPSAGVLHIRSNLSLPHTVPLDDSKISVLNSCLDAVAVPVDQYWCAASQHHGLVSSSLCGGSAVASRSASSSSFFVTPAMIKRPDPNNILNSFYATRLDAISHRHYVVDQGTLVIAVDNRTGSNGKMFSTLPRQELISFVEAIPLCHHRNLYVVVDENAAVDPFFDIDCSMPFDWTDEGEDRKRVAEKLSEASTPPTSTSFTSSSPFSSFHATTMTTMVERWLGEMLHFLRDKVESATGAKLQHCVVLTSSVLVHEEKGVSGGDREVGQLISSRDSKLSFHVHFRLDSNTAFANVRELHKFMLHVRDELDASISQPGNSDAISLHRMLRRCIDFGVYTRWRAFRLPYNVKFPPLFSFNFADAAALELMIFAISNSSLESVTVPDVDVGAVAPSVVHLVDLSSLAQVTSLSHQQQQRRMITKLFFLLRFLLPIVPGMTFIGDRDLSEFLSRYAPYLPCEGMTDKERRREVARAVFDLALIQRENCIATKQKGVFVSLRLITMDRAVSVQKNETLVINPFFVPRPPHHDGVRVPVCDKRVKELVAEVFRCLCRVYDGNSGGLDDGDFESQTSSPIVGDQISVQFQDGIRAYYAQQKKSKFCMNQGRSHRGTYPQLYLTYGSIKLRCYSNDCYRRCLAVRWSVDDSEKVAGSAAVLLPVDGHGYPRYERLAEIRHLLFPPLSPEELLRRYGSVTLEGV